MHRFAMWTGLALGFALAACNDVAVRVPWTEAAAALLVTP